MDKTSRARITVKAQPRASKTELGAKLDGVYKLRLAAPPVDGKANEACIRFFAGRLRVAPSAVTIVHGLSGRTKIIEIEGIDQERAERALEHED